MGSNRLSSHDQDVSQMSGSEVGAQRGDIAGPSRKAGQLESDAQLGSVAHAATAGGAGGALPDGLADRIQAARARGAVPLSPTIRASVEKETGANLSSVR